MSEKHRKEIESLLNKSESGVNKRLQKLYKELVYEINSEIVQLAKEIEETDKFSKKLQKERLEAIRSQMFAKVNQLEGEQKKEIFDFLRHDGHVAFNELFYDFEMTEEIPLSFTMLTDKQINVIINTPVANRKLSTRLKGNSTKMKQNLNRVLTRGFAKGLSTQKMAVQIAEIGGANYRRALNIARTESGRVTSVARQQSQNHAKSLGLKLEKQWISTLDKLTRHTHQLLDGKIVGIDEYFEIAGHKALQPHMFGIAAEDCNCRCRTITIVNGMGPELRRDNETKEVIEYQDYDKWLQSKTTPEKEKDPEKTKESIAKRIVVIEKAMEKLEDEDWGDLTEEQAEDLYDKYDVEIAELREKFALMSYNEVEEQFFTTSNPAAVTPFFANHQSHQEWRNNLSEKDIEIIESYTMSGYRTYNRIMREGEEGYFNHILSSGTSEEFRYQQIKEAKRLAEILNDYETQEGFTTYRTLGGSFDLDNLPIGTVEVFDDGFMSTSLLKKKSEEFGDEAENVVILNINVGKGKKVGAYIGDLSTHSDEKEFLIKPKTKFKVLGHSVNRKDGANFQYIDLEVIE